MLRLSPSRRPTTAATPAQTTPLHSHTRGGIMLGLGRLSPSDVMSLVCSATKPLYLYLLATIAVRIHQYDTNPVADRFADST